MKINKPLSLFLILAFIFNTIHSQNENHIDGKNHNIANEVLNFLKIIDSTNTITYILHDKVLVVEETKDNYTLQFLDITKSKENIEFINKKNEVINKKNKILKNAFKNTSEIKMFSEGKYYGSAYVYFRLMINNKIIIEFNLPFITYTIERDYEFPINKKLMGLLTSKILDLH